MHIKRFEAATVQEALARIRSELGPDALILETQRATDGSGWFEVTAALPHGAPESTEARARQAYGEVSASTPKTRPAPNPRSQSSLSSLPGLPALRPQAVDRADRKNRDGGMSSANVVSKVADILSRLPRENVAPALTPEQRRRFLGDADVPKGESSEIEDRFRTEDRTPATPSSRVSQFGDSTERNGSTPDGEEIQRLRDRNEYLGRLIRSEHFSAIPLPLRELYLDLSEAEVDANLTFQILMRMGQAPMRGSFQPVPVAEILPRLETMVSVGGDVRVNDSRRVIALVGPTGVGKTTTLAKIAGQVAFGQDKKVALVSTDAYRVFGAQHLGSYATLMDLPFAVAATSEEIRQLLEVEFADCDLVLIDTSGRSPRDPEGIEEIHQILGACPEVDIHLVLAANARVRDMAFALEGFSRLPIRHLIFTKLDETTRRGGLFTLALKARRPVAYLGTGQEVPDDLLAATARGLTEGIAETEGRTVA